MVFSIFGRKDKSDSRRGKDSPPTRTADTVSNNIAPNSEQQREIARKTAEKIDRIESEMIAVGLPPPPAPKRVLDKEPLEFERVKTVAAGAVKPAAAMADASTSMVIGDTADAGDIQVNASSLPPELEEAAILFANGQASAAEATLQQTIKSGSLGAASQQAWVMLFDVFQSTGQKDAFENMSLDYAAQFELSPPAWRENVKPANATKGGFAGASILFAAHVDSNLTKQFDQIKRAAASNKPAVLEFVSVQKIDNSAADLLVKAIEAFKASKHAMVLANGAKLYDAVIKNIETGRRDEHQASWMLALEILRAQGLKQQFDDMSIDYCVTYEVSPPSWEPMPAWIHCDTINNVSAKPAAVTPASDPGDSGSFVMAGEIVGRMQSELSALRLYAQDRHDLILDCRDLLRLDFVAAGELLNEVVTLRNTGKSIVFVEPNFLVLALMKVMGIHELADIRRRKS